MRASDNSNVVVCIENLLQTYKGEVPYARGKGIDPEIIDMPEEEAEIELVASADECIDEYEPRVETEEVEVDINTVNGNFEFTIDATEAEEEDE